MIAKKHAPVVALVPVDQRRPAWPQFVEGALPPNTFYRTIDDQFTEMVTVSPYGQELRWHRCGECMETFARCYCPAGITLSTFVYYYLRWDLGGDPGPKPKRPVEPMQLHDAERQRLAARPAPKPRPARKAAAKPAPATPTPTLDEIQQAAGDVSGDLLARLRKKLGKSI